MASNKNLTENDLAICRHAIHDLVVADRKGINKIKKSKLDMRWRTANSDAYEMSLLEKFLDILATEPYSDIFPKPIGGHRGRIEVPEGIRRQRLSIGRLPNWITLVHSLPSECHFSEGVEVFRSLCNDYIFLHDNERLHAFCNPPNIRYPEIGESYEQLREYVNAFIKDLRLRLRERKTRQKILERRRAAEENSQEFIEYVEKLFGRIARHLVLRIDLGYWKPFKGSIEDLVKDLDYFHANMRHNTLFNHMTGYIEKIEYGMEKGVHVHLILFFDASKKQRSDTELAKNIGEYWSFQITKGRGFYWNCNASEYKRKFEEVGRLGIGEIHETDKDKIDNLKYIIRYFCKSEQFIKLKTQQKMKLLRKGQCRNPTGAKRGAPRASQRKVQLPDRSGNNPVIPNQFPISRAAYAPDLNPSTQP